MFFEPFIVLRNNQCSTELANGFDPRYFVPLLHLPMASASKHCLRQPMADLYADSRLCLADTHEFQSGVAD